jgi:hypothetical protein
MKNILKKIVKCFIPYGIIAMWNKFKKVDSYNTFVHILTNLKQRGILINTIIDIGASDGRWSNDVMKVFPDSKFYFLTRQQSFRHLRHRK